MKDSYGKYEILSGYEGKGVCWQCGAAFPDHRARRFCSTVCRNDYETSYYWRYAAPAALARASYRCQDCGASGDLQVHHIVHLNGSKRAASKQNKPENLIVVCKTCHNRRHAAIRNMINNLLHRPGPSTGR